MVEDQAPGLEDKDKELRQLEGFGLLVTAWVKEAVDARDASGIESRWRNDLRQYYGEEVSEVAMQSLAERASEGPQARQGQRQTRSRIVVNITRPKTNAAIARLSDMLLPVDDKNWGIQPTPNPMLSMDAQDRQTKLTQGGQPMMGPGGQQMTVADAAAQATKEANRRAKLMEAEIDDQLTECNYNAEQRKALWDLGVLGTAILRGPYAKTRKSKSWTKGPEGWELEVIHDTVPAAMRVSPWRFFPDPACGGDVSAARFNVELDTFNSKTLRDLRDEPGFIRSQVNLCLQEGPKSVRRQRGRDERFMAGEYQFDEKSVYEVWIVHGTFPKGELYDAIGQSNLDEVDVPQYEDDEKQDAVSGCVFICNGRVIKAYINPIGTDEQPYSVARYENVEGQVFGVGVPYILRNPQRVVTAAWRMVMDNSALSAGGQIVMNRKLIEPADGSWEIRGTKVWFAKDGTDDVRATFATFQFDTRQQELMQIIDKAMQLAEDESSLPALMEGSTTDAPQTVGVATTLTNNANTVLRRLVKTYDDDITDSLITRFYDWNMENSDKDEIKGDYQVDARGSSVLLVRDMQKQALAQIGSYVLHPAVGPFHKRRGYDWLRTMYESNHISPDSVLVGDDEADGVIQRMEEAAQQQPQDPRIATAQINAEVQQAKLNATMQDADRERQFDAMKYERDYELAVMKYANENNKTLEEVKASLTELMLTQRHKERMQEREINIKARMGSGI